MRINPDSKLNLQRDRNVLGKKWKQTYNGYFGDKKNALFFSRRIFPFLPKKKELNVLYPASTSGFLGEELVKFLKKKRINARLCIVDISKEHLKENRNPETKKVLADIIRLDMKELFDVIIMRSSLDYFPEEKMQVKVLRNLKKHLASGGIFFNQTASMPSIVERDLADRIYNSGKKIGHRHFQCKSDVGKIYKKAGLALREIGSGAPMLLTEKDHRKRYGISKAEIKRIQKMILEVPERKRKNIFTTESGYCMKFVFPLYAAKKK